MRTTKFWILFFALVLALSATAFFACGGGDDDDDDDDAGGDDDDVSEGEPGTLHGFVRDFQTKTPVQDADVEILNDETGDPFDPPITATSPSNGEVSFDLPDGVDKVGVKVTKSGSTDTVQFHFDSGLQNEEFLLVSNATKDLVALSLGKELDETKSVFAGAFIGAIRLTKIRPVARW
ncbi:MAG: hypothetical protein M5R36_20380 [Deltaproteobacteria bacterium]|nr:hypothetical protein [Deltaproteobacteria bacterium]